MTIMIPLLHTTLVVASLMLFLAAHSHSHPHSLVLLLELCGLDRSLFTNVVHAIWHSVYYASLCTFSTSTSVYHLLSFRKLLRVDLPEHVRCQDYGAKTLTPPVGRVREGANEERDVVMFGRILNCEYNLNERVKRLSTRPLKILFGLKHDLVSPRLKRVRGWEEVQAPPVRVRDGGSGSDPCPPSSVSC